MPGGSRSSPANLPAPLGELDFCYAPSGRPAGCLFSGRVVVPRLSGAAHTLASMTSEVETPAGAVPGSVRAQLLATEHWSLLASRTTTQNELLVRIAMFLTLVSASIVGLALIGQATQFDGRFDVFAIVLFSILL